MLTHEEAERFFKDNDDFLDSLGFQKRSEISTMVDEAMREGRRQVAQAEFEVEKQKRKL